MSIIKVSNLGLEGSNKPLKDIAFRAEPRNPTGRKAGAQIYMSWGNDKYEMDQDAALIIALDLIAAVRTDQYQEKEAARQAAMVEAAKAAASSAIEEAPDDDEEEDEDDDYDDDSEEDEEEEEEEEEEAKDFK